MSEIDLRFDNGDTSLSSSSLYEIGTNTKQVFGQDESVYYTALGTLYNAKWYIYNTDSVDIPAVSEGQFPCIRIKTKLQNPSNLNVVNSLTTDYRGGLVAGEHFIHTQPLEATAEWLAEIHEDYIVSWSVFCEIYYVDANGVEQDREDLGQLFYNTLGDGIEHVKLEFDSTEDYIRDVATETKLDNPIIPLSDLSLYQFRNKYYNRGDDITNAAGYPMTGVGLKFKILPFEGNFCAENLPTVFAATLTKDTSTSATFNFPDNFKNLDHAEGVVPWIAYFEAFYYNAEEDKISMDYDQVSFSIDNTSTAASYEVINDISQCEISLNPGDITQELNPTISKADLANYLMKAFIVNLGDGWLNEAGNPQVTDYFVIKNLNTGVEYTSGESIINLFDESQTFGDTYSLGNSSFMADLAGGETIPCSITSFASVKYNRDVDVVTELDSKTMLFSVVTEASIDFSLVPEGCFLIIQPDWDTIDGLIIPKESLDQVIDQKTLKNDGPDLVSVDGYPRVFAISSYVRTHDGVEVAGYTGHIFTELSAGEEQASSSSVSPDFLYFEHESGIIEWTLKTVLIYEESEGVNQIFDTHTRLFSVESLPCPELLSFQLLTSENQNIGDSDIIGTIGAYYGIEASDVVNMIASRESIWMNDPFENPKNLSVNPDYKFLSVIPSYTLDGDGELEIQDLATGEWVPLQSMQDFTESVTTYTEELVGDEYEIVSHTEEVTTSRLVKLDVLLASYLKGVVDTDNEYDSSYYKLRGNLRTVSADGSQTIEYPLIIAFKLTTRCDVLSCILNKNNNDSLLANYNGVISLDRGNTDISFVVPKGTDITSLSYDIELYDNAYINESPISYKFEGRVADFSTPKIIELSSENGETMDCTIEVAIEAESNVIFSPNEIVPYVYYIKVNSRVAIEDKDTIPQLDDRRVLFSTKVINNSAVGTNAFIIHRIYDFKGSVIYEKQFDIGYLDAGVISNDYYSYCSMAKLTSIGTGSFFVFKYEIETNNEIINGKFYIEPKEVEYQPLDTIAFNERIKRIVQKNFFPKMYFSNGDRMYTFPDLNSSNESVMWMHGNGLKQKFYGELTDFKLVFHVNTGQDSGSFKEFLSLMIESSDVEFDSIIFETEHQTSEQDPFGDVKFWELPKYIEGRWQIPVSVQTSGTDIWDEPNGYYPGGYLRGSWLKITLVYKGSRSLYIKQIITNYIIQKTF